MERHARDARVVGGAERGRHAALPHRVRGDAEASARAPPRALRALLGRHVQRLVGRLARSTSGPRALTPSRAAAWWCSVRPRRPDFDWSLLPIHTQVTGLGAGARGHAARVGSGGPGARDAGGGVLHPAAAGAASASRTTRSRRGASAGSTGCAGAKVAGARAGARGAGRPGLRLHGHAGPVAHRARSTRASTPSLLNRPDTDYFRRTGVTGLRHVARSGTRGSLGAEYRRDTYASLVSFTPPLSLFRRTRRPSPTRPWTRRASARWWGALEYASDGRRRASSVGSLFRSPSCRCSRIERRLAGAPPCAASLTLEVGDPALGGDEGTLLEGGERQRALLAHRPGRRPAPARARGGRRGPAPAEAGGARRVERAARLRIQGAPRRRLGARQRRVPLGRLRAPSWTWARCGRRRAGRTREAGRGRELCTSATRCT